MKIATKLDEKDCKGLAKRRSLPSLVTQSSNVFQPTSSVRTCSHLLIGVERYAQAKTSISETSILKRKPVLGFCGLYLTYVSLPSYNLGFKDGLKHSRTRDLIIPGWAKSALMSISPGCYLYLGLTSRARSANMLELKKPL